MKLVVAATGTGIGKTYVTCGLARALQSRGEAVRVLKPVLSGFDPLDAAASDAGVILTALGRPVTPDAIDAMAPFRFAAPLAPDWAAELEGRTVTMQAVLAFCRRGLDGAAHVVIETAGGVLSPLSASTSMADLMVALDLPVLLVAGSYLGTFSHTLTALEALGARGLRVRVCVSESAEAGPDFAQTLSRLRARLDCPVFALPRAGLDAAAAGFERLLAELLAG